MCVLLFGLSASLHKPRMHMCWEWCATEIERYAACIKGMVGYLEGVCVCVCVCVCVYMCVCVFVCVCE